MAKKRRRADKQDPSRKEAGSGGSAKRRSVRKHRLAKPFDWSMKELACQDPEALLELLGYPKQPVRVIDAEVTVSVAILDKLLEVSSPSPHVVDVEFVASPDPNLLDRLVRYASNIRQSSKIPLEVRIVLVLLRPEADSPQYTGHYVAGVPGMPPTLELRYDVIRVWERDPEFYLNGPIGLVPLAPLARKAEEQLPSIVAKMRKRIEAIENREVRASLALASNLLLGLKYPKEMVIPFLLGDKSMRESFVYQDILQEGLEKGREEGEIAGKIQSLLKVGACRLGEPSAAIRSRIHRIKDEKVLDSKLMHVLDANSWEHLLDG